MPATGTQRGCKDRPVVEPRIAARTLQPPRLSPRAPGTGGRRTPTTLNGPVEDGVDVGGHGEVVPDQQPYAGPLGLQALLGG
jgi:hypothetical protein